MQDENVKVTSTLVDHPLVTPAFAYRFDGPDRSIVISGDTARSDNLAKFARGADVLVHGARRDGSVRDTVIYSVLAQEWPDVRRHLELKLTRAAGPAFADADVR